MAEHRPHFLLRAADREKTPEGVGRHPLNPKSEVHGWMLGDMCGLQRVGLHLMRLPPGKESFELHTHRFEEEFMFVLSGRGVAEVDDKEYEIGPGDFLGFATPSVAHQVKNPFDQDLVYLSGGERREFEVGDFPRHAKRMYRTGKEVAIVPLSALEKWPLPE